jgi:hypothetical protein
LDNHGNEPGKNTVSVVTWVWLLDSRSEKPVWNCILFPKMGTIENGADLKVAFFKKKGMLYLIFI